MGEFSNLNFINSISCLTNYDYYEKIFVDFENIHMGYASCQFFKNGQWVYVIIDTLLPFSTESKKFLFSHCGSHDIFWVALLEKAYAKLHGNYGNMKLLSFEDILVDLCNCHIKYIDLKDPNKKAFFDA